MNRLINQINGRFLPSRSTWYLIINEEKIEKRLKEKSLEKRLECEPNEKEEDSGKKFERDPKKHITQTYKNSIILNYDDDIQRRIFQIANRSNSLRGPSPNPKEISHSSTIR